MNLRSVVLMIAAAILAAGLVGCGGGGGPNPLAPVPGAMLTFDTSVTPIDTKSPSKAIVNVALDDGALVKAYDYATGLPIKDGTIEQGKCQLTLKSDLTVLVVATGTKTVEGEVRNYRLSMIIAETPAAEKEYTLEPVSSLAAEAIVHEHPMAEDKRLSDDIVQAVEDTVLTYLDSNPDETFYLGGSLMPADKNLGEEGSIDPTKLAPVIEEAAKEVDDAMVDAKNAVQQIKQAGIPFQQLVLDDRTNLDAAYHAVESKYRAVWNRIGKLIGPAAFAEMKY
ncbi:MAG: hypothetical protein NTU88_10430 [Armatimonadetes bacterium]|nr:hypothetical protein [Armatimonadota bacterium]